MEINIVSLFDGHSTGRLVCQRAGIDVDKYYASEIDENAIHISKNNFDDIIRLGDITKIDKELIQSFDMINLFWKPLGQQFIGILISHIRKYKISIEGGKLLLRDLEEYQNVS